MKIAFNPSTVAALITPPNNKDITFDLRGQNIFARGVKFCGTDTNTWRDIKINNVSIDSNTLDLRDGDNTTLTNINGVVTINSTWRPVVDNLTSDSTTSSLSANLGRVLVGLIDDKSDSDHNHDDRYLKLTGGTMLLGKGLKFHADNSYFGTDLDARIISLLDSNDKICNGGLIIDERTTLDDKEYITELLRIRDSEFKWKGNNILHSGNSYIKENTITINGSSTTWENTWRTILVNDISIGKAPLNIKAGNGISLSESNGTITVTSTSSSPNVILLQYLSDTDTNLYPLIWGGSDHNNTNDSIGAVYKSYDKLSWLTSSLTLYATNLYTGRLETVNNHYYHFNSDATLRIYGSPNGNSERIYFLAGIDNRIDDYDILSYGGELRHSIILNPRGGFVGIGDTNPSYKLSVGGDIGTGGNIYISHNTNDDMSYNTSNPRIVFSENGSLAVGLVYTDYDNYRHSKGLKVMDVNNDDTGNVWFEVLGYNYSSGYVKNGSNDNYVLLGGGGHKDISDLVSFYGDISAADDYSPTGLKIIGVTGGSNTMGNGWGSILLMCNNAARGYKPNVDNGSANWYTQIMGNTDDKIRYRTSTNGAGWTSWKTLLSTADFNWTNLPGKIVAGNEFNIINAGFNGDMWFNYLPINDRNSTAYINSYIFGNGNYGLASILASGFIKSGSNNNYVLLGGGGHKAISDFVRAFGTSNDNIDSDWGQSFKTFDPIPSGTPPELNPNISILNIGEDFNRRKLLAFTWNNDNIYYRRRINGTGFTNWVRLALISDVNIGGAERNPIFLGYLNLDHGNDGTVSSSFYCLGYSVPFTYTRGGNYCRIYIPDTTHQVFYIRAAIASVNYSGGGMDTWVGEHRGDGAWWLHCYASSTNEVRVKGFHLRNNNNDSWWGGNPLWSGNSGANRITVCIFGYVTFR